MHGTDKQKSIAEAFRERGSFCSVPGVCPHCGVLATFKSSLSGPIHYGRLKPTQKVANLVFGEVSKCDACHCVVFGLSDKGQAGGLNETKYAWPIEIWPDRAPPHLEQNIKQAYDEARVIVALSAMGAAVLARRCLQLVLRNKLGVKSDTLFKEIEDAQGRDELSKPTRLALHHIREIGNWGAHPCLDQANSLIEVERHEAEYTLETLELVFHDLYVMADRAEAMAARISTRKAGV